MNDDPAGEVQRNDEHARVIVMGPGDGPTVGNPAGGGLTYKARSRHTGGALTVWESTAAPGEGPPLHLHINEHEFMYVLEGRLRFRLDETEHPGPGGSSVFIPRGVPHTWQNTGDGHARILFVFTPASPGMERFFERSAELPQETRMAEAFKTLASDAGMEVLGPPLEAREPGVKSPSRRSLPLVSTQRRGSVT